MTDDLFASDTPIALEEGAVVLRSFAHDAVPALLAAVDAAAQRAPFRRMLTPGGQRMSAEMTSCGGVGWVTDRRGYRYEPADPETGVPWLAMPPPLVAFAGAAAAAGGFGGFVPDACLINRYAPGARMSLHQDRDERDLEQPIVSVSLGLPVVFLFGGMKRSDRCKRVELCHGDVVVWGGPSRLRFHGVLPLAAGEHPVVGPWRINLTFRRAR